MKGKNTTIMAGIISLLIFSGCATEPAVMQNEKAVSPGAAVVQKEFVQELSEEQEILCRYLGVPKEKIKFSKNLTDAEPVVIENDITQNRKNASYEVEVEGETDKSGYYCFGVFYNDFGEKTVTIAKALTEQEIEELHAKWNYDKVKLCKTLYSGLADDVGKKLKGYKTPEIVLGKQKSYKEVMANAREGMERAFINESGQYESCVIRNTGTSVRGQRLIFQNGKWKSEEIKIPKKWRNSALDCEIQYQFGQLWYEDESRIAVSDDKGNILGSINFEKWEDKHGVKADNGIVSQYMPEGKVILNIIGKKKSYLVDVKTGEIRQAYDFYLQGEVYGKYIIIQNEYDITDKFQIVEWETGKIVLKLDVKAIRDEQNSIGEYMGYQPADDNGVYGFIGLDGEKEEIPGYKFIFPFDCCISKNRIYFKAETGVYSYDRKQDKLIKVLEGEKYPQFKEMSGDDFDVAEDGTIYMFHLDCENNDFLYLKPQS